MLYNGFGVKFWYEKLSLCFKTLYLLQVYYDYCNIRKMRLKHIEDIPDNFPDPK